MINLAMSSGGDPFGEKIKRVKTEPVPKTEDEIVQGSGAPYSPKNLLANP